MVSERTALGDDCRRRRNRRAASTARTTDDSYRRADMTSLEHVAVEAMDPRRFRFVIGPGEYQQLLELIDNAARALRGRVIWNVSSTAKGGGVVELLRPLLGYSRGSGVDARWVVITGGREFFEITKRMHNHLHGVDGDGGLLSAREQAVYESTLARTRRNSSRCCTRATS